MKNFNILLGTLKEGKIGKGSTHRSPRVRRMYNNREKAAYKKTAEEAKATLEKKGVRPSQGEYYDRKLKQELLKKINAINIQASNRITLVIESPRVLLGINVLGLAILLPLTLNDLGNHVKNKSTNL